MPDRTKGQPKQPAPRVLSFGGADTTEQAPQEVGPGVVPVDLDALIRTRLLIQAESGGGKSWAVRALLEGTYGVVPHIVFDPENEYHTLREAYDDVLVSATPGEGDPPARQDFARRLCRRIAELGDPSVILDLSDLEPDEQQTFTHEYIHELLALDRGLWTRRLCVIDEAETLAPEGASSNSKTAVASLVTRGRKRGIGWCWPCSA